MNSVNGKKISITNMQKKLYLYQKMYPRDPAYNLTFCYKLTGALDLSRFEKVCNYLFEYHESFKVNFSSFNGAPSQCYDETRTVRMQVVDLFAAGSPAACEQQILADLAGLSEQVIELDAWPLVVAKLFRCNEELFYFTFNIHHIIADAYSYYLWLDKFTEIYNSPLSTEDLLKDLPQQNEGYTYFDYVAEEKSREPEEACEFFREQLSRIETLGMEYLQQDKRSGALLGKNLNFELDAEFSSEIDCYLQSNHVSGFSFFLSIYMVFLHKISRQQQIVTGVPLANRRKKRKQVFGYFVNTLPLAVDFDEIKTFAELNDYIQKNVFSLLRHQDFDFNGHLQEILKKSGQAGSHDALNNAFTFYKQELNFNLNHCKIERIPVKNSYLKYPLTCTVEDTEGTFNIELEYYKKDFEYLNFKNLWENLIGGAIAHPDSPLAELHLLSPQVEKAIYRLYSKGERYNPGLMVHERIEAQVRLHPERVALKYFDQMVTYEELNKYANRIAHYLEKTIAPDETKVAIFMNRSPELIAAILAVLKLNRTYVPIDTFCPESRMQYMLEDLGNPVVLSESVLAPRMEAASSRVVYLDSEQLEIEQQSAANLPVIHEPDRTAYIIYTSGSTGKPKGVMVSHHNVVRLFDSTEQDYGFNCEDTWTLFHSYAFDFSVWEIFGSLFYGGKLVIVPQLTCKNPAEFYSLLINEKVTVLNQTPSYFRQLIIEDQKSCRAQELSLRYVIFGGEAVYFETLKPWFEIHGDTHPRLINMYGITETTVHVTYYPISAEDAVPGKGSVIGWPLSDLEICIANAQNQIMPIGIPGEILVAGAGVSLGYYQKPELTAQRFVANPFGDPGSKMYRSGDLGRYLPDGTIEYLGRIDKQIQLRGYRIELGEIESVMNLHPQIKDSVAVVHQFSEADQRLVAYLICESANLKPDLSELKREMKKRLPEYMIPAVFVFIAKKPLTINGKLDYAALPDPAGSREGAKPAPRLLVGPAKEIAEIWKTVLQLEDVGLDDNFFDLGGNSLHVPELCEEIIKKLSLVELSVVDIYEHPTLRSMAAHLSQQKAPEVTDREPVACAAVSVESRRKVLVRRR